MPVSSSPSPASGSDGRSSAWVDASASGSATSTFSATSPKTAASPDGESNAASLD
eukprot:CAMPEP_0204074080 /NCGR_PEP_ID=MMETSP0360-20130528/164293_1 /ASSEMBLY_ACC=CAM_ASM_000342 /TAXON_ID=268821 /ORGANISM="Scrippsiella Hangoei, Strain SHTV-5" /LENGTH=54 /DNA_ID=CAMNT_0051022521 /DNA_START=32 /DNA_END=193 /DNA_ORIENTATION=-